MANDTTSATSAPDSLSRPAGQPPQLPVLRFGLRHLLGFMAVVGTLLAGMVASDGVTALVLLLTVLVVVLHVSSTALGHRLNAHAERQRAWEAIHPATDARGSAESVVAALAAGSPLYGRRSSIRWLPLLVAAGALLGVCGGAVLLSATVGQRASVLGIAVGAISLGVVGGWFAFLGTSFWTIVRQGWLEAVDHQKQDEAGNAARRGPVG
jgi:hypothetical protein